MINLDDNQLYREVILEHYKHPLNSGLVSSLPVFCAKNPSCGDTVSIQVEFDAEGKIKAIHQNSAGCSISVSSVSILTSILVGKTRAEAIYIAENFLKMVKGEQYDENVDFKDAIVFENIKNYPARFKCATVSWSLLLRVLRGEQNS